MTNAHFLVLKGAVSASERRATCRTIIDDTSIYGLLFALSVESGIIENTLLRNMKKTV